jgi:hypothetical protein
MFDPMFFARMISTILLAAFMMVSGAVAFHTHADEHHNTTVVASSDDDHTSTSDCGLCHVTKERATQNKITICVHYATITRSVPPLVANFISDECTSLQQGRAPPRK